MFNVQHCDRHVSYDYGQFLGFSKKNRLANSTATFKVAKWLWGNPIHYLQGAAKS